MPLYALTVELTLVESTIAQREMRCSGKLQAAFAIDDVTAIGIVEQLLTRKRLINRPDL